MPKIAELKKIDGEMWAKIPVEEYDGQVSLYSEYEIEMLKRKIALSIMDQIDLLYPKPSR